MFAFFRVKVILPTMETMTRQEEQQAVLEQAQDAPGVREVVDVYGQIAQFSGIHVVNPEPVMGYATGGNC